MKEVAFWVLGGVLLSEAPSFAQSCAPTLPMPPYEEVAAYGAVGQPDNRVTETGRAP